MLLDKYKTTISKELMSDLDLSNVNEVPKIVKVVLNIGAGKALENSKLIDIAVDALATITGQRPVVNRAKNAISNFKLREGQAVGVSVILRKEKMWNFLDRLINISLPRVRDFRGIASNKFDGRGNFNFGIKEHIIFPEIDFDKSNTILGMDIAIVTTAKTDEAGKLLLTKLGFPFRK